LQGLTSHKSFAARESNDDAVPSGCFACTD
jgi:hypothetical protein